MGHGARIRMQVPFEREYNSHFSFVTATDYNSTQQNCLGTIRGAKYLTRAQLEERGFISTHIAKLLNHKNQVNQSRPLN